jgi:hypothetical protein
MKPIAEMTLAEFGAFVASHLQARGIEVVLTGGGCVAIYSENRYTSFDLDFVGGRGAERRRIQAALRELGFTEKARYFSHPDTHYLVEFPSGPLAVGDEPVKEIVEREFSTGKLRLLSATDCVKDRLAGYFHWRDLQCLEQAALVATANIVDLDELERWSRHEGMLEEFTRIRHRLVS